MRRFSCLALAATALVCCFAPLAFLGGLLAPVAALAQAVPAVPEIPAGLADAVPGWLGTLASVILGLVYLVKFVHPLLNEHVDAFKRSKVDEFVTNWVVHTGETTAKGIRALVASGKYTPEKGQRLLAELASEAIKGAVDEFGSTYLGPNTKTKITHKVETMAAAHKAGAVRSIGPRRDPS